jgi:hypothetical protein
LIGILVRQLARSRESAKEFGVGVRMYCEFWKETFDKIREVLKSKDEQGVERLKKSTGHWRLTSAEFDL